MRIHNVHERVLDVPLDEARKLIDQLGQPDDLVFPTPQWPPMVLEAPLAEGVKGGHGPMRYCVKRYEPGRLAEFETEPGVGIAGSHTFELEKHDDDRTTLRHTVDGELEGGMRLVWPVAMRPIHDAMVEDILDQAERATGHSPKKRQPWSPWVRLIRRVGADGARRTTPPKSELLDDTLERVDFADAHEIRWRRGMPTDARQWAERLFDDFPPWVLAAMALRQALARPAGIQRQTKRQAFKTYAETADEVILGSDADHLDFRVGIRREEHRVVVTTVVQVHNRRGRAYWFLVGPLHPAVIRSMLRRAASHH